MLLSLLASSITAALTLALGLPLALGRRSSRGSLSTLVFDAMLLGTAVLISGLTMFTWLGWVGAVLFTVALAALIVLSWRQAGPIRAEALRPRWSWYSGCVGLMLAAGMVLRLRTVDAVQWTGDMGNYVNAANRFSQTGLFELGFPPGFGVYLAVPAQLLGVGATTASVPFLGFLLLGSLLRLMSQLRLEPLARLVGLGLATFSIVSIWFSSFPVSESLQAPLTVAMISMAMSTLVEAPSDRPPIGELGSFVVATLALGLTRGTGLLLLVPLFALLVACIHPAWRSMGGRAAQLAAAGTLGLGVSYLYGVDRIAPYFVDAQIEARLPTGLMDLLDGLSLFEPSLQLLAVGVVVLVGLLSFGVLLDRWAARSPATPLIDQRSGTWPLPLTAVLAIGLVTALAAEGDGEIFAQVERLGLVLLVGALLAFVVPGAVRGVRGPAVLMSGLVALTVIAIQTSRFEGALPHVFFLYWDRYLFSEVLPLLVVLSATTVGAALSWAARNLEQAVAHHDGSVKVWRVVRLSVEVGAVALLIAFVSSQFRGIVLTQRQDSFDGVTEFYEELVELLPDRERLILWTGPGAGPDRWPVFPNSWHAFGKPLQASYGRQVLNFPRGSEPFAPDPVLDTAQTLALLGCLPDARAYVVEFSSTHPADLDERLSNSPITVDELGSAHAEVPLLRQLGTREWETMVMDAHVWQVRADPAEVTTCPKDDE